MSELTINDQIVAFDGNGWAIYPLDRKLFRTIYLARNRTDLVNSMGGVILTLTAEQVQDLIDRETSARDERRAAEQARSGRGAITPRGSSVSQAEYNNLRESLSDKTAAHMARMMQG